MAVLKCTSLYTVQRQVFLAKNLLLHGTTDIPVRSELLAVSLLKRDGTDTLASAFGNRRCGYKELAENKAQAYL